MVLRKQNWRTHLFSNAMTPQTKKQTKVQDYFELFEYLRYITLAAGCPLKRQGDPLLWSIRWAQE